MPDLSEEKVLLSQGFCSIGGVDEVGMGCLAGPVVASCVVLDLNAVPAGIDDSKKLTAVKRKALDAEIRKSAVAFSVAFASVEEIDRLNIFHAAKLAMKRAVEAIAHPMDFLLIDGKHPVRELALPSKCLVKGDATSFSIAAASIVAKVYRDAWMERFDLEFPGYFFAKHKGYGSPEHRRQIQTLGQSPIHRKSFSWKPV